MPTAAIEQALTAALVEFIQDTLIKVVREEIGAHFEEVSLTPVMQDEVQDIAHDAFKDMIAEALDDTEFDVSARYRG